MNKIDKQRKSILERAENQAIKLFQRIENKFLRQLIEQLETILIITEGKIEATTANVVNLYKLGFFLDDFRKENAPSLVKWMAKKYISIAKINSTYFKDYPLKNIDDKIKKNVLKEYGIKIGKAGLTVTKFSFIDQLARFDSPYEGIRALATSAINQGMDIVQFKKLIKDQVKPKGKYGAIVHHLYTNANDSFARFDRNIQKKYALELGLWSFIYTGGKIQTTRKFCDERNGKVFTVEEAEEWKELDWDGKNANYNPLDDLGGHNCRHFKRFIGEKEAIRRRPDLKKYYEDKKARNN